MTTPPKQPARNSFVRKGTSFMSGGNNSLGFKTKLVKPSPLVVKAPVVVTPPPPPPPKPIVKEAIVPK